MTDDRVETHVAIANPGVAERPTRGASRSTGSGCAPRSRPRLSWWSGWTTPPRDRGSSTPSPTPAWWCCRRPTRWCPWAPNLGVPRVREAIVFTKAPGVASPHRRRRPRARDSRADAHLNRGRGQRGRVGLHYGARSRGGVLDGWLVDEKDADQVAAIQAAASPAGPSADDDRPRGHGRRWPPRPSTSSGRMSALRRRRSPTGCRRCAPGDDLSDLSSPSSTSATATSSW